MKYGVFTHDGERMIALVPETEDERELISKVEAAIASGDLVSFKVDIFDKDDQVIQ